jgi:hypothetical protein
MTALYALTRSRSDRHAYLANAVAEFIFDTRQPRAAEMATTRRVLASLQRDGYARAEREGKVTWWFATAEGRRVITASTAHPALRYQCRFPRGTEEAFPRRTK